MWATGATHMIARLTGSTLFANHNLASIFTYDHRSFATSPGNVNVVAKMRDLRARSPYALFMKDNYREISAKNPNLKLMDVSKKVAEVWKSLSDDKKQTYVKRSQDQKANYEEEKKRLSASDLQTVDADQKAKRIENRIKKTIEQLPTKRPRTAYAHYLSSVDRGEADLRDFMKGAAQRWKQMSAGDKKKFEDLHEEEKQKYAKALVAWASTTAQEKKATPRRSSSASPKARATSVKKTRGKSATRKRAVKKRAVSAAKSTKAKSSKAASDKETSSSDDELTRKTKKSIKAK